MRLTLQILAAAQALEKAGQRIFQPHGLTNAQFNVLNILSDQAGGMRASELARILVVDPSNVTGLLQRMKAEGYLKKFDNPTDRRQHVVGLTPKGQKVWRSAFRDYQRAVTALETRFQPEDDAATRRVLGEVFTFTTATP